MLDTLFLGLAGMNAFSKGLRTIGNNVANMNTPGFKKSQLLFEESLFNNQPYRQPQQGMGGSSIGYGVRAFDSRVDFSAGETRQTGSQLDMAVDGGGYFILRTADGELRYTRAAQFEFDDEGWLRNRADRAQVMGMSDSGELVALRMQDLITSAANPTGQVRFTGYLSTTAPDHELTAVRVFDRVGAEHLLNVKFTNQGSTTPGTWRVTVSDGLATLGEGTLRFVDGKITDDSDTLTVLYTLQGLAPQSITFDFSTGVTAFASGTTSTLTASGQDGYAAGRATSITFDASGALSVAYSNGQSVQGDKIALARFDSEEWLSPVGTSQFVAGRQARVTLGTPRSNGFGALMTGRVENSNVDLSQEFSDLVVMQRGYQAASQAVSTANELIQSLFDTKGRR